MNSRILLALLLGRFTSRTRNRWTRPQLEAFQAAALGRLRHFTDAHSRFYQMFHDGRVSARLGDLPVLKKSELMEHFDELVTDPTVRRADVERHAASLRGDERFAGRYWVCSTSGSSGTRATFVFDTDEWISVLSSFDRGVRLAGFPTHSLFRAKVAAVTSTTPWHMSARAGTALKNPLFERLFDLLPVDGWQLVCRGNQFTIRLSGARGEFADGPLLESIRRELATRGAALPLITIERVEGIPRGPTGKSILIEGGSFA